MSSLNVLLHGRDLEFQSTMAERMTANNWRVFKSQVEEDLETLLEDHEIDVAILDVSETTNAHVRWINIIKAIQPLTQVICITPKGNVGLSISGMRHGAFDDLQTPFAWSSLLEKIQAARTNKETLLRKKGRAGFWQSIEDHLFAGSMAQSGAPELAREWLKQKKQAEKAKKKNTPQSSE